MCLDNKSCPTTSQNQNFGIRNLNVNKTIWKSELYIPEVTYFKQNFWVTCCCANFKWISAFIKFVFRLQLFFLQGVGGLGSPQNIFHEESTISHPFLFHPPNFWLYVSRFASHFPEALMKKKCLRRDASLWFVVVCLFHVGNNFSCHNDVFVVFCWSFFFGVRGVRRNPT